MHKVGTVHTRTFEVHGGSLVKPEPKIIRHADDIALNDRIDEDYQTAVTMLDGFEDTLRELTSYDNTVIEFEEKGPFNPATGSHWKGKVHQRVYDLAPERGQVVALPTTDGSATTKALSYDPEGLQLDPERPGTFPRGVHLVDQASWSKHPDSVFSLDQQSGLTTIFMERAGPRRYYEPQLRYDVSLSLSEDGKAAEYRLEVFDKNEARETP